MALRNPSIPYPGVWGGWAGAGIKPTRSRSWILSLLLVLWGGGVPRGCGGGGQPGEAAVEQARGPRGRLGAVRDGESTRGLVRAPCWAQNQDRGYPSWGKRHEINNSKSSKGRAGVRGAWAMGTALGGADRPVPAHHQGIWAPPSAPPGMELDQADPPGRGGKGGRAQGCPPAKRGSLSLVNGKAALHGGACSPPIAVQGGVGVAAAAGGRYELQSSFRSYLQGETRRRG